jgi:hypothetical protein
LENENKYEIRDTRYKVQGTSMRLKLLSQESGKFVGGTSVSKKGALFFVVKTGPTRDSEFRQEGLQFRRKGLCSSRLKPLLQGIANSGRRDFSPEERGCVLRG